MTYPIFREKGAGSVFFTEILFSRNHTPYLLTYSHFVAYFINVIAVKRQKYLLSEHKCILKLLKKLKIFKKIQKICMSTSYICSTDIKTM